MTGRPPSYADAGVDIEAGDRAVQMMRRSVASTARPEVLGGIGGFSAAFAPDLSGYASPVLLSATDGVGTKLAIAQTLDAHTTVGVDLVAMVVDDLVCDGGEPLFLLDYIACGKLVPERVAQIVEGIAAGCRTAGCALVGGETAEHPGVMDADAYDLAAFAVGVAERDRMPSPSHVRAGDVVLGLASSGLHSNGYSLVRRLILMHDLDLFSDPGGLGSTLGEALLTPTRIYAPAVLAALREHGDAVRALAHVTGGGLAGNLVRALPDGVAADVDSSAWPEPPIFSFLRRAGGLGDEQMRPAFNMGIGMTIVVDPAAADAVRATLERHGETVHAIGSTRAGARSVRIS